MIRPMTKSFASTDQYPNNETYVDPTELIQVLGNLLCTHPDVVEGDRLQISFPVDDGRKAIIDSYWTYMTIGAAERPSAVGSSFHRELLGDEAGLIGVRLRGEQETAFYQVAKPSALAPGQAELHFEALMDSSVEEISMAVTALANECGYARPVTTKELYERMNRPDLIPALDTPQVFLEDSQGYELLKQNPEHTAYHQDLHQVLAAARTL